MTKSSTYRLLMLLLVFISAVQTFSQTENVRSYPMPEKALLWQIEGPTVKNKCYLFGTMHIIPSESFFFPKKLEKAITKSERLVMEIGNLPDQTELLGLLTLEDETLNDFLDKLQMDSLKIWVKSNMGFEGEIFNSIIATMKPVAIVQMATQLKFGDDLSSYELSLQDIALENNQEIQGLETVEKQLSLFDDLSKNDQADLIMDAIRDDERSQLINNELLEKYMAQDIDGLYQLVTKNDDVITRQQTVFLNDRNLDWIPKIKFMLSEKKTFIAVGAGHLGGPQGVIRLLEKEGYTLTPIKL